MKLLRHYLLMLPALAAGLGIPVAAAAANAAEPAIPAVAGSAAAPLEAPVPVTPEHFLPQLAAQLATHFRPDGELQLDLLRNWTAPATPASAWEMTVVAPPPSLAPQLIVRVRLVSAQRSLGEWNLPLRVRLWADAFVARQPLPRGQFLDTALFDLRRTDFIHDKEAVPASTALESLSAARGLGVGAVLSWRDVVRRSLVQRGSRVEVLAGSGALTITMKGLAMQNGALGETIVVRNPESRRDFSAVVTAENQARVTF
ncbi:MAG: flagellar basal body P-ring formation protein FlgA [Opitutaceae bacterium]|nr:flagellar basal body P-ring formation protein FlgA [Opitutaceae bacterium]